MFVFFKQKTAYEMRISDWSSDVCSSDLTERAHLKMIIDALARRDPETVAFIAADMEVMAEASLRNHKLTAFERGGWISQTARMNEQGDSKAGTGGGQSAARKNPAR